MISPRACRQGAHHTNLEGCVMNALTFKSSCQEDIGLSTFLKFQHSDIILLYVVASYTRSSTLANYPINDQYREIEFPPPTVNHPVNGFMARMFLMASAACSHDRDRPSYRIAGMIIKMSESDGSWISLPRCPNSIC